MLVRVERLTESAGGAVVVEVRTSVGTVTARWRGDRTATPGAHHVEWTLDEEFRWGLNCFQTAAGEPRVRHGESAVVFRGRLMLDAAGEQWATLVLGDALIMLGHIEALPDGVAGAWVEIHVAPENIEVHPYVV